MVGLDQDLMQKNLSCKNIGEAKKNMLTFTAVFVVINIFFLSVGALLYQFAAVNGISPTELQTTDHLFPEIALNHLGTLPALVFMLGLTAATFATTDSALTALTTSFCVDFLGFDKRKDHNSKKLVHTRHLVHVGFSVLMLLVILIFKAINDESVVTAIFKAAGYTYGPLLGLFSFGMLTKRAVNDRLVPFICIISPLLSFIIDSNSANLTGYVIGFELIIINAVIAFVLLCLSGTGKTNTLRQIE
jgi:Na+/proline symporter